MEVRFTWFACRALLSNLGKIIAQGISTQNLRAQNWIFVRVNWVTFALSQYCFLI